MGNKSYLSNSKRDYFIALITVALATSTCLCDNGNTSKGKRQIYREEVLPFKGGKIPEAALRTDRLNLNQLQREGFSLPDGVVLYNRRHLRHPFPYHQEPELLKVFMTDDGRFVSVYGKYTTDTPDTIDTTYLIRSPIQLDKSQIDKISEFPGQKVFKPSLLSLIIPTRALFGKALEERRQYYSEQYNGRENHVKNQEVTYKYNEPTNYYQDRGFNVNYNSQRNNNGYAPSVKLNQNRNNYFGGNVDESNYYDDQGEFLDRQKVFEKPYKNQNYFQDNNFGKTFNGKCSGCLQKVGYGGPKSRVWISRYFPSSQKTWSV